MVDVESGEPADFEGGCGLSSIGLAGDVVEVRNGKRKLLVATPDALALASGTNAISARLCTVEPV